MTVGGLETAVKVHSFLKQCLHDLCLTQEVVLSSNYSTYPQLMSAKRFGESNTFLSNTVLKTNEL